MNEKMTYAEEREMRKFVDDLIEKATPKPVSRSERYGPDVEATLKRVEQEQKERAQAEKENAWELEAEEKHIEELTAYCNENMRDILIYVKSRLQTFYNNRNNPELKSKDANAIACELISKVVSNFYYPQRDEDKEIQRLIREVEEQERQKHREGKERYEELLNGK